MFPVPHCPVWLAVPMVIVWLEDIRGQEGGGMRGGYSMHPSEKSTPRACALRKVLLITQQKNFSDFMDNPYSKGIFPKNFWSRPLKNFCAARA